MIDKQQILWRHAVNRVGRYGGRERCLNGSLALLAGILLALAIIRPAAGQLAITEAMSAASTNILADFWRSLNREIIICLERSCEVEPFDPKEWLAKTEQLRKRLGLTGMSDAEVRAEKRRGRP